MSALIPDWVVDAPDILDSQCLLRRIPDHALSGAEPDSSNFREKEKDTGLSVTLWESAKDIQDVLEDFPQYGITTLVVADVRSLGLAIVRMPLQGNINHCEIWGIGSNTPKKLKRVHSWAIYNACIPLDLRQEVVQFRAQWEPRGLR
jgi:hypothetical protein